MSAPKADPNQNRPNNAIALRNIMESQLDLGFLQAQA